MDFDAGIERAPRQERKAPASESSAAYGALWVEAAPYLSGCSKLRRRRKVCVQVGGTPILNCGSWPPRPSASDRPSTAKCVICHAIAQDCHRQPLRVGDS